MQRLSLMRIMKRQRMKYEEFERIYQEYYLKILTFIHKRVPDLYEAEELTGDVFLSFYRNMDSYTVMMKKKVV